MKEIELKNLVVGEIYYDVDNHLKEALRYKGEDKEYIYFLPLESMSPYQKRKNGDWIGCIAFDKGFYSTFYQEQ